MTNPKTGSRRCPPRAGWRVGLVVALAALPGVILADRGLQTILRFDTMPWLPGLMQWWTWLGFGPVDIAAPIVIGLVGWWRGQAGCPRRGVLGGIAVTAAGILDQVVKNLTCRSRPSVPGGGMFLTDFPCVPAPYETASFPSGHATTAFALAAVLSLWYPRWTGAFLAVAALVGWSRIVLGSHFPSDVLAGAILGSAVVLGLSRVWPQMSGGEMRDEK